ncbi:MULTISPECIES: hypothetical protein [Ruficoccus]|uniref:Uncharacterized protein n=1 Tax=Ruficoccus amylovorans TaxID=1804625 RepID=A0A842HHI0_9BACT|nr:MULTISPECIES: hypothetical protein [Ruficoccus]MBC2595983.1 hypothetical protein [Ruficoccus amylovorans]QYY36724.1 hypothetical protein K0V07_04430 [Ruficoccus sp. ZRK36]
MKAKKISVEEFDRRFDDGEDISEHLDWSTARRLHGGKREGAGRKSSGRHPYTIRLKPQIHAKFQQRARKKGISLSEYIEELVKD